MKKICLIFFPILLAVSCSSVPPVKDDPKPAPPPVVTTKNTTITNVRVTDRGNIVVPNILFKRASATLIGDYTNSLSIIKAIMTADTNAKIIIEGHTSIEGRAYPYNYELSKKRANAVYNYMTKNMNISKSRLIIKPLGEGLPEYKEYPKNRRVEFVVIKNETELTNYNIYIKNVDTRKEHK